MTPGSTPSVIVVGGGLAGLVAARHLASAGGDVTLYEQNATVGGRVRTLERDGFRFDCGFQVLFEAYPAVRRELDLEGLALQRFSPGASLVGPGHRSVLSDPLRDPKALSATLFNTDVTVGDKLRVLRLRRRLAQTDPEKIFIQPDDSIDAFLRSEGFSDRFIKRFAAPFYGGITLDRSLSTSSRVFKYTFQTLSKGPIAIPASGMGAIAEQLAFRASAEGVNIETGRRVTGLETTDGGVTIELETETQTADAVVVATDPPTAADLTGLETIPTDARSCVTQYYELGAPLDGGKRLLLNMTETGPNHVAPHSSVAPSYAPDGRTLISGTFLGDREEDDEELATKTRDSLVSWYPERSFEGFNLLHTERVPFAQFQQPPGIHERLPGPRDPSGPVYLAGDFTQWSAIQGALESGRQAAKAVIDDCNGAGSA